MKSNNFGKLVSLSLALGSALLVLIGYLISKKPEFLGLCSYASGCMSEFLFYGVGHPLYLSIYPLTLLFVALMFVKKEVFQTWWRIALPVGIVFILIALWAPPLSDMFTPDRTWVTKQLSLLFVIISAIIVGWKYWRLSRN